jgi:hypothetical protein
MPEIILTEEQARVLREAKEPVILHDAAMTVRIVSEPYDAVALANYHRQVLSGVKERGIPGDRIPALFAALQAEKDRVGHLDKARAKEIAAQFQTEKAM